MKNKKWWLFAFGFCLLLATLSPLASSSPDGLEYVAEEKGFVDMERSSPLSVIADYVFPGIENEALATILAGWVGTTLMFILAYGVTWLVLRARGAKSLLKTD
ncbi:MAG: PDGLE domain-containing protein [Dehalococcoidia bacterium]|nr:PDGLE domain-containing protein [Dehalococcoidia bacterium]